MGWPNGISGVSKDISGLATWDRGLSNRCELIGEIMATLEILKADRGLTNGEQRWKSTCLVVK